MHSWDIIGYAVDCDLYCDACAPRTEGDDVAPVFADSEADCPNHCAECEALIDQSLTSDGVGYVIGALLDHVVGIRQGVKDGYCGRSEILDQWRDMVGNYRLDGRDEKVVRLYDRIRDRATQ